MSANAEIALAQAGYSALEESALEESALETSEPTSERARPRAPELPVVSRSIRVSRGKGRRKGEGKYRGLGGVFAGRSISPTEARPPRDHKTDGGALK